MLFTSHGGLRAAYQGIKRQLEEQRDPRTGAGHRRHARGSCSATLSENHRTVVLGAASFWEGVDVTGEALSLLIIARLPFAVPSDPVYQARSELFDQPFEQYALPQAILRFKQGFGRLIRRKTDRGVMVVLDRRLRSRRYGDAFLRSLPACELRDVPLRDLAGEVTRVARPSARRRDAVTSSLRPFARSDASWLDAWLAPVAASVGYDALGQLAQRVADRAAAHERVARAYV